MTDDQWKNLIDVIEGKTLRPLPVGFIVDSPWLPGWAGVSILDYYTNEHTWFEANLKAIREFPDVMLLPGFWAEYGMCSEPSAFGAKCIWHERSFPFADRIASDHRAVRDIKKPDPRTDGLCPFMLARLKHYEERIRHAGHQIRLAVARGPLNVASFLLGHNEFLLGIKKNPEQTHALLQTVTDFLADWIELQATTFPFIDGLLLLDDLIGFIGEQDFKEFALPHLRRLFQLLGVHVKFLHNDAHGLVTAAHLREIGVNLFNFGSEHSLAEMKRLTGNAVTLLGNIPPRDVLAQGSPDDIRDGVRAMLRSVADRSRIVFSCGGGMPPDVPTENIRAFCAAVREAGE
jgi:uroporphyrinogen-III decarboxylase